MVPSMAAPSHFWAVIPAAGSARRMGTSSVPKQYLTLRGRAVLEWSAAPFLSRPDCAGVVVVIASDDRHWPSLDLARNPRVTTTTGGAERCSSVQRGLRSLQGKVGSDDWVLVHDAARPCLSSHDLQQLLDAVRTDEVGGLLAAPMSDTIKRADADGRVEATVDRSSLWRALTPQMFRYGLLERALSAARNIGVTDEAQAVELLGSRPRLVPGSADNIKITVPEDLQRAEHLLARMEQQR